MKKFFLLFIAITFSAPVWASGVGNGGFVIQCGSKIQLFDYFEGAQNGMKILSVPGTTLNEKIETLLSRLETIDPNRAESYRYQYQNYWIDNQTRLSVEGLHLTAQEASNRKYQKEFGLGSVSIPANCQLVLAIQQMTPTYEEDVRERIATRLFTPVWNRLDLDTKAGLILHELFYREYLVRNFGSSGQNSKDVRHLNAVLNSDEFSRLTSASWINVLNQSDFSAMFPAFRGVSQGMSIDLEAATGAGKTYGIYDAPGNLYPPGLTGNVSLTNNANLEVKTDTDTFWNGLFPRRFKLQKAGVIDLSAWSKFPLKVIVDPSGHITVDQNLAVTLIDGANNYLKSFGDPDIQFSGPVGVTYVGIGYGLDAGPAGLYLEKTAFSILRVKKAGSWTDASDIRVDLQTGKITNR